MGIDGKASDMGEGRFRAVASSDKVLRDSLIEGTGPCLEQHHHVNHYDR